MNASHVTLFVQALSLELAGDYLDIYINKKAKKIIFMKMT